MNTEITTRHCQIDDDLKERTEERLQKLQRFFDRIMESRVVLTLEGNRYQAEATVVANGTPLKSHAEAESEHVVLDQVIDKLEAQLRKHKDRLTTHRRRARGPDGAAPEESGPDDALADLAFDDGDLQNLIREEPGDLSVTMSVAEAVAQLKASRREVLGFRNGANKRISLVFKRRDGNVGIVDVEDPGRP